MAVCCADDYLTVHTQRVDLTGHVHGQPLVEGELSLKTIHHMDPLQDPLFWSKGQGKAKFYSKSQS